MADNQRIEDLRRRVQKDPASIAFAQLAEELRRDGQYQESVEVCQSGLKLHPGYLSARVTLGRALLELNELDAALSELTTVLKSAPENLAAIRGVAEIHHRRNDLPAALAQYRAALLLARNDPDLQRTVDELARQVEPPPPAPHADGLSFDEMQDELFKLAPPPLAPPPPVTAPLEDSAAVAAAPPDNTKDTEAAASSAPEDTRDAEAVTSFHTEYTEEAPTVDSIATIELAPLSLETSQVDHVAVESPATMEPTPVSVRQPTESDSVPLKAEVATQAATITALERFLDGIHVARAERGA